MCVSYFWQPCPWHQLTTSSFSVFCRNERLQRKQRTRINRAAYQIASWLWLRSVSNGQNRMLTTTDALIRLNLWHWWLNFWIASRCVWVASPQTEIKIEILAVRNLSIAIADKNKHTYVVSLIKSMADQPDRSTNKETSRYHSFFLFHWSTCHLCQWLLVCKCKSLLFAPEKRLQAR